MAFGRWTGKVILRPDRKQCRAMAAGLLVVAIAVPVSARAEKPPAKTAAAPIKRNITMKTLGGRQFWGDVAYFHGWRIQQNIFTKHYRLLDKEDYRHASGTLAECRKKLAEIKRQQKLPPMKGKAVILIHGIIRSSKSMQKMRQRLQQEGYLTFGFDYPSTRVDIPSSAGYLRRAIDSLDGIEEINFVVHSMGGLIVRQYCRGKVDPRIKRMVMLGVPNNGAQLADKFRRNVLFRAIFGPAGQQLGTKENGLISQLPVPPFEFAVIAGGKGTLNGYNPLVPGDDDGTVSVRSTRLPGAADFLVVRSLHSFLMSHPEVMAATVRFLKRGHLRADGKRHPIPRRAVKAAKPHPAPAGG